MVFTTNELGIKTLSLPATFPHSISPLFCHWFQKVYTASERNQLETLLFILLRGKISKFGQHRVAKEVMTQLISTKRDICVAEVIKKYSAMNMPAFSHCQVSQTLLPVQRDQGFKIPVLTLKIRVYNLHFPSSSNLNQSHRLILVP